MENPFFFRNFQKSYLVVTCFNPSLLLRNGESLFNIDDKNRTKCAPILSDLAISVHPAVLYHKYQVQL